MCLKSCSCCIYSSAYVVLVGFNWCCCPPAGRRYSNLLQITHWLWIRVKLPPLTIRRKKELVYNQLWKLFTQWNREFRGETDKGILTEKPTVIYDFLSYLYVSIENFCHISKQMKTNKKRPKCSSNSRSNVYSDYQLANNKWLMTLQVRKSSWNSIVSVECHSLIYALTFNHTVMYISQGQQ